MRRGLWALGFLLLMVGMASASYITLKTTVTTVVDRSFVKVSIASTNRGDETAYNLQAEMRVGDKKVLAGKSVELGVGQTYKAAAVFPLAFTIPGQYPLVLVMHYTDANQYPFSALNCQTFTYKTEPPPADIFGNLQATSFWKNGELKLSLKNIGDKDVFSSVTFAVPRELTVSGEASSLRVPAKAEKEMAFDICNFSALNGSSYQIFALAEYAKDGVHYVCIIPGTVRIVENRNILGVDFTWLIAALVLMIIVFCVVQFVKK